MKKNPSGIPALLLTASLAFFPVRVSAQPADWARVHEVTMRGVNLIYDLEMARISRL